MSTVGKSGHSLQRFHILISWAGRPRAQSHRLERDVGPVLGQVVRPRSNGTTETWGGVFKSELLVLFFRHRDVVSPLALVSSSAATHGVATQLASSRPSASRRPFARGLHRSVLLSIPKFLLQVGPSSDDRGLYLVPLLQHALQPLCLVSRCLEGSVVLACGCASSASSVREGTCARSFPSKSVFRQKSLQPTLPVLACVTRAVQALVRHPARVSVVGAFILVPRLVSAQPIFTRALPVSSKHC